MKAKRRTPLLFAGSSHRELANEIAGCSSIPLAAISLGKFPDGEISFQILESVRGRDTFVIQTIAPDPNNQLMELLIMIDALKRASAKEVVAVIPYFGYCRQDRKDRPRVPITAKLVANLLVRAGATRVLTMDLHAGQLEGFFDIPVDNLRSRPLLEEVYREINFGQCVVVAPDVGSVKLARAYANHMGGLMAVVDKQRIDASHVQTAMVIGDVQGKDVLLADDMCSTAGTLVSAAKACREKGAKRIVAAVTHGLFSGQALEAIEESPIEVLLVSNTIAASESVRKIKKIRVVSVASLFSQAIDCILAQESISSKYEKDSEENKFFP